MEGNTHKGRCQRSTDVSTYEERFEGLIMLMCNIENRFREGFLHTCSFMQTYAETGDWPRASLRYSMKEEVLSCRKKKPVASLGKGCQTVESGSDRKEGRPDVRRAHLRRQFIYACLNIFYLKIREISRLAEVRYAD